MILNWLALKWLAKEGEISKFEKLGGTLIRAVLLLLVTLLRRPKGSYSLPNRVLSREKVARPHLFSVERLIWPLALMDPASHIMHSFQLGRYDSQVR